MHRPSGVCSVSISSGPSLRGPNLVEVKKYSGLSFLQGSTERNGKGAEQWGLLYSQALLPHAQMSGGRHWAAQKGLSLSGTIATAFYWPHLELESLETAAT